MAKKKKKKLKRTADFKKGIKWGLVWKYPHGPYSDADYNGDFGGGLDQGGTVTNMGIPGPNEEENLFESYMRKVRHGRHI